MHEIETQIIDVQAILKGLPEHTDEDGKYVIEKIQDQLESIRGKIRKYYRVGELD